MSDKNKTIRIPERYPSGKKKRQRGARNAYVEMHRVYDHWDQLRALGVNEDFGTVIGRLFMLEAVNAREATAARIYGEVMGKFDRYHNAVNRMAKSPSYQRGSRGQDNEIERLERNGTIREHEKRAKRALKAYKKLTLAIPSDSARRLLDEVCIYDIFPLGEREQSAVKQLLGAVASNFGLKHEGSD